MKNKLLKTICCFILISSITSCLFNKKCKTNYHFEFPVTINPPNEIYSIGDTIWIDITYTPGNTLDLNNNSTIDIADLDLNLSFGITRFNDTIDNYGIDNFEKVIKEGDLERIDLVDVSLYKIIFSSIGVINQSRFGIIPNTKGNFALEFESRLTQLEDIEVTDSDCKESINGFTFKINNGADNGYDFYINNIDSPYSEISFQEYTNEGVYSFEVID